MAWQGELDRATLDKIKAYVGGDPTLLWRSQAVAAIQYNSKRSHEWGRAVEEVVKDENLTFIRR